ncbi:DUF1592 domain-containing protein [Roseimaritima sediminicola]|uniref:DUF1592 domain-containing protein n=1 Tax=Roseimaritima sediminicola TaxID=2662066 RepID=UPI00129825B9|nr:DUF1592 domain-containing protein [Roseimaritima sediminicola]
MGETIRVPGDRTQEEHVEGLPLGTRGGVLVPYTFPRSGEYEIRVRLVRDRDELVEGLLETHHLDLLLDDDLLQRLTIERPRGRDHTQVDAHLRLRFHATAGPHRLGVTFPQKTMALIETKRQPFDARFNQHRHPRQAPAVQEVSIVGPLDDAALAGTETFETPSRRRIFIARPQTAEQLDDAARQVIGRLLRRAYRRPVSEADFREPLRFFADAAADRAGTRSLQQRFEAGIEAALTAILVNPHFLFHLEWSSHADLSPDFALASRLAFFLWSGLPDDTLWELALQDRLSDPVILRAQVQRMLEDPRSERLVENFADQWLYLRNLETMTPDLRAFPDFDDNLRDAFRRETQHYFAHVMRADRSVLELLHSDYTFLNQRLAKHYEIPHVYGSHFRKVTVDPDQHRGGLLRHGSLLMVTSYATRTSPTIRGNWVLENILGTPPPPPPPDVPAIQPAGGAVPVSFREQLAQHRANAACASCHDLIDPVGFSLDRFDALGRWRTRIDGERVDARGRLPDGTVVEGVAELEAGLLQRPEMFVQTMAEKLLTFALGRHVEPRDMPAVRQIVRSAREHDYRFSELVVALAASRPFQAGSSEE